MRNEFEKQLESAWPSELWKDHRVLVAVSGGADSVALLRSLIANSPIKNSPDHPTRIVAAHFNHRWRGAESDADVHFVERLCEDLGIEAIIGTADLATDQTESTARRLRYDFIERSAETIGARYVATAHTADDQVETVLHRLLRGTGIGGLQGIPRFRLLNPSVTVMRPLLSASRTDVLAYLKSIGQDFREDSSNEDRRYTRNRIRHELLPQLRNNFNPEVDDAIRRLALLAGEHQNLLSNIVSELFDATVSMGPDDTVSIDAQALHDHSPLVTRELFIHIWKQTNWPRQSMGLHEWSQLASLTNSDRACFTAPGKIECRSDGSTIRLKRLTSDSCG